MSSPRRGLATNRVRRTMTAAALPVLGLVSVIWIASLVGIMTPFDLPGVVPRHTFGLVGIATHPFAHANLTHLISNTLPLLVLGGLLAARGRAAFIYATVVIVLASGALVWAFARGAEHIGASGLVFGYLGYLVARGWVERAPLAVAIAIGVVVIYGGLIWGVLPTTSGVSFEAHLAGLLAGIAWALLTATRRRPSR